MDTTKAVMVDVQICFFLLDESPCVGLFHKDSDVMDTAMTAWLQNLMGIPY